MSAARACILAVGTELTTGQISNTNAAWLSEKLTDLGLEVALHETVPDDRPLILSALKRCEEIGAFLFVMGGLGPTTDDFTREVVAEWLGAPLHFHEPSWQHIHQRLSSFGVPVVESQRQQCLYPESAEVFTNEVGTANAFFVARPRLPGGRMVWVLPGPPREISWLWENGVREHVVARVPRTEPIRLFLWHCLGRSEAELGEAVEHALAGTGVRTGYRFQRPYVEVKVWCPESRVEELKAAFARLETALGDSVVARDGKDLAEGLLQNLSEHVMAGAAAGIEIRDATTAGILAERLGRWLREPQFASIAAALTLVTEPSGAGPEVTANVTPHVQLEQLLAKDEAPLILATGGITASGDWPVGIRVGGRTQSEMLRLPYRTSDKPEMVERMRRYATEVVIQRWTRWLRES